ncbi:MAG: hypothetical protein LJE65_04675 [Desulfobacteraceae bacterium]|nr:hypothetical protein [Desulfobacteraceae bacterium]
MTFLKKIVMRSLQDMMGVFNDFWGVRTSRGVVETVSVIRQPTHAQSDPRQMETPPVAPPIPEASVAVPPPPVPNPHWMQDASLFEDPETLRLAGEKEPPPLVIEKWIAAGFLYPEEVRAAEKLMRSIRSREKAENRMPST